MSEFYGDSPSPPDQIVNIITDKDKVEVDAEEVLKNISELQNEYDRNTFNDSFAIFLKNSISRHKADKYIEILNNCKCCAKHQLNRPKNLNDDPDLSFFKMGTYKEPSCYCKCRHYSRWLYRAHSEKNYF